jgi:predicted acyltransferase
MNYHLKVKFPVFLFRQCINYQSGKKNRNLLFKGLRMTRRIVSVDIFRGMTIALMILVNNPGSWAHIYPPFRHAEWFGVTPTDWVFPFFLFIVGTSIVLAYHKRDTRNLKTYKRIFSRTVKLLLLGWFLAGFKVHYPFFKALNELRFPGVLVRIGIVFFSGALIYLFLKFIERKLNRKAALVILATLITATTVGYWYVMIGKEQLKGIDNQVLIETRLNKSDNLVSQIDRKILGVKHMWRHYEPDAGKVVQGNYDPEGLLSTVPALATALLGMILGYLLIYVHAPLRRILWMTVLGVLMLILAYAWEPYFPFSKKLWTSSFVFYTGGLAFLFFAVIYFLTEFVPWKSWQTVWVAFGMNAIAVYVLNGIIAKSFYQIKIGGVSLHNWLFEHTWKLWIQPPKLASLMYALSVVVFYAAIALYLYRKKIFIKV